MTFCHQCLGGELTLTKLGDSSMREQLPREKHDRVINAHLRIGSFEISVTDWMASPAFEPFQGNTYAIFVTGDQFDELNSVFEKLADGADTQRFQDLHELPIGTYGQFYVQFGVQRFFLKPHDLVRRRWSAQHARNAKGTPKSHTLVATRLITVKS